MALADIKTNPNSNIMVANAPLETAEDVFHEIAKKFYSDEIFHSSGGSLDKGSYNMEIDSRVVQDIVKSLSESKNQDVVISNRFKMVNGIAKSEDMWFESQDTLSWACSKIAAYNPFQKVFRCADCECEGFMSRVAEHWLGTHGNVRAFQCPRCPYTSAWARCARMHLSKHHNEPCADNSLWKGNRILEEITNLLQNLKNKVEKKFESYNIQARNDKRYVCSNCPYSTDRKDLFTRHENIHSDEKPFHCYVCHKQFNRADHVKKHFLRIHKETPYEISKIRRFPSKNRPQKVDSYVLHLNENVTISPIQAPTVNIKTEPPDEVCEVPIENVPKVPSIEIPNYDEIKSNIKKRIITEQECKKEKQRFYSCPYCDWRGADNWCLKRHLNTHIKPYGCSLCGYKAARPERLGTHVYKIHHKRVCTKCTTCFDDAESLAEHIFEMHQSGFNSSAVSCPTCGKALESISDLEVHYIIYHRQLTDDKKVAGGESDSPEDSNSCPRSKGLIEAESEDSQDPSKDTDHQVTGFACLDCGCSFANKDSYETHKQLHNSAPSPDKIPKVTYKCSLCNYGCWSQRLMMDHMRVHTGVVWECRAEECQFATLDENVLYQHVKSLHNDPSVVRCPHCGLLINSMEVLSWHRTEHHTAYCGHCAHILRAHFGVREVGHHVEQSSPTQEWVYDISSKCLYPKGLNPILEVYPINCTTSDSNNSNCKRNRKQTCPRKVLPTNGDSAADSLQRSLKRRPIKFCVRCRKSFFTTVNYLMHIRWHHGDRKLK